MTDDGKSRRQRQREKRALEQREADLKWLMADARGRRIVQHLLGQCLVGANVFTGNSNGFHLQGKQAIGNGLVAEIKAVALEEFHAMELEARRAKDSERVERESTAGNDTE